VSAYLKRLLRDNFSFVLIVVIVTTVCVVIFLLPAEIKDMLVVKTQVFNPLSFISANFVSYNLTYLLNGLSTSLVAFLLLHIICRKVDGQKIFSLSVLMVFTILPLIYLGILFPRLHPNSEGYGLSLVNSGLIGLSITYLVGFYRNRFAKFDLHSFFTSMRKERETFVDVIILCVHIIFYIISIPALFPSNIILDSVQVDVFAHSFGLVFGFVVGFLVTYSLSSARPLRWL